MQIIKNTPLELALVAPAPGDGDPRSTLVAKATFAMVRGGVCVPAPDPRPCVDDVFHERDGSGSLRYPSDLVRLKPRGECLLAGTCFTPGGESVPASGVAFRVGAVTRTLAVFGDRHWTGRGASSAISAPQPFAQMALRWERAYGGPGHRTNPFGVGKRPAGTPSEKQPLPNLEDPRALIATPADGPDPAGCFPRARRARDARRISGGAAASAGGHNSAPPEQQIQGYWRGDEEIALRNLHPKHALYKTRLPGLRARCFVDSPAQGRAAFREVDLHLDTIVVDADAVLVHCVFRAPLGEAGQALPDDARLFVSEDPLEAPRSLDECHAAMLRALRGETSPTDVSAATPAPARSSRRRRSPGVRGQVPAPAASSAPAAPVAPAVPVESDDARAARIHAECMHRLITAGIAAGIVRPDHPLPVQPAVTPAMPPSAAAATAPEPTASAPAPAASSLLPTPSVAATEPTSAPAMAPAIPPPAIAPRAPAVLASALPHDAERITAVPDTAPPEGPAPRSSEPLPAAESAPASDGNPEARHPRIGLAHVVADAVPAPALGGIDLQASFAQTAIYPTQDADSAPDPGVPAIARTVVLDASTVVLDSSTLVLPPGDDVPNDGERTVVLAERAAQTIVAPTGAAHAARTRKAPDPAAMRAFFLNSMRASGESETESQSEPEAIAASPALAPEAPAVDPSPPAQRAAAKTPASTIARTIVGAPIAQESLDEPAQRAVPAPIAKAPPTAIARTVIGAPLAPVDHPAATRSDVVDEPTQRPAPAPALAARSPAVLPATLPADIDRISTLPNPENAHDVVALSDDLIATLAAAAAAHAPTVVPPEPRPTSAETPAQPVAAQPDKPASAQRTLIVSPRSARTIVDPAMANRTVISPASLDRSARTHLAPDAAAMREIYLRAMAQDADADAPVPTTHTTAPEAAEQLAPDDGPEPAWAGATFVFGDTALGSTGGEAETTMKIDLSLDAPPEAT